MRYRILIHPPEYEVGRTEALYERMAAKGWLLKNRVLCFSLFERGEPQALRYRLEFSTKDDKDIYTGPALPEEQVAWYEACGWRLAAFFGSVSVFCTPQSNEVSELYSTPEQLADTMQFVRKRAGSMMICSLFWLTMWILPRLFFRHFNDAILFLLTPALWIGLFLFWLSIFLNVAIRTWGFHSLYRKLRAGHPICRTPRKHRFPLRYLFGPLCFVGFLLCMMSGMQSIKEPTLYLPTQEPMPILQPAQAGQIANGLQGASRLTPRLTITRGVFVTCWEASQDVYLPSGDTLSFNQSVYSFSEPDIAVRLMPLLATNRWNSDFDTWLPLDIPGFDRAFRSPEGNSAVAVQGNVLCRILYAPAEMSILTSDDWSNLLTALSEQLADYYNYSTTQSQVGAM